MKNKIKNLLWAMALLAFSFSGFAAEQKIATVDMLKVIDSYHKTKEVRAAISNEVDLAEKEIKSMLADQDKAKAAYNQANERANDMSISADEREKSKKVCHDKAIEIQSMQTDIERYNARAKEELNTKQHQRMVAIFKEISDVLDAMSVKRGYNLVLDKSGESVSGVPGVLYTFGNDDLTDTLIHDINTGALPVPPADPKSPETKPTVK